MKRHTQGKSQQHIDSIDPSVEATEKNCPILSNQKSDDDQEGDRIVAVTDGIHNSEDNNKSINQGINGDDIQNPILHASSLSPLPLTSLASPSTASTLSLPFAESSAESNFQLNNPNSQSINPNSQSINSNSQLINSNSQSNNSNSQSNNSKSNLKSPPSGLVLAIQHLDPILTECATSLPPPIKLALGSGLAKLTMSLAASSVEIFHDAQDPEDRSDLVVLQATNFCYSMAFEYKRVSVRTPQEDEGEMEEMEE